MSFLSILKKTTLILFLGAVFLGIWLYASIFVGTAEAEGSVKGVSTHLVKVNDAGKISFGASGNLEKDEILYDLKVTIYPEDKVNFFPDPKLGLGTTVTIDRAPVIYLEDAKVGQEIRTWQKTVADLLTEKGITLAATDQMSPEMTTEIKDGLKIIITRIGIRNKDETVTIPYTSSRVADATMYKGDSLVKQKGKDGTKILTHQITYTNGEITEDIIINENITLKPVGEIILYGTKPRITVRCRFDDIVIAASMKYGIDPNALCRTMMLESNGNPHSDGGAYKGLFQYSPGTWADLSFKAGYGGASIWDATAQIYTTAWAWSHGYRGRWPNT